jgi:hypothetical protein
MNKNQVHPGRSVVIFDERPDVQITMTTWERATTGRADGAQEPFNVSSHSSTAYNIILRRSVVWLRNNNARTPKVPDGVTYNREMGSEKRQTVQASSRK